MGKKFPISPTTRIGVTVRTRFCGGRGGEGLVSNKSDHKDRCDIIISFELGNVLGVSNKSDHKDRCDMYDASSTIMKLAFPISPTTRIGVTRS